MTPRFAAALRYFTYVYAAGFAFGMVRVPVLVPRLGERWAELAEMPLMLAVTVLAARAVLQRAGSHFPRAEWLRIGLYALAMLGAGELLIASLFQPGPLLDNLARRDPVSGTVYLGMLVVFAAMPWFLHPRVAAARQAQGPPPR